MSDYKETKLYRRTKYIIFEILVFVTAIFLINLLAYLAPQILSFFARLIASIKPDDSLTASKIISFVYSFPKPAYQLAKIVLFLFLWGYFRGWFIGGWLSRLIVAIQRFKDQGLFSKGGNARFSGIFEETLNLQKYSSDIYFGRSLFSRFWSIGSNSDKHMITIGGTRSGKGACCIIPNLLNWSGSILCIDPKGTNTHVTAECRRRMGQTVHILDPFHVTTTETACFNPLDSIDPTSRTAADDIKLIADALIPEDSDTKNPHFPAAAKAIFSGYVAHVLTSGLYKNPSLIDVFNIIHSSGDEWIDTHARMMMNTSCGKLAKIAAVTVHEGIDKGEHHSVVSTMKTQLHWLASEVFSNFFTCSTFSFEDMKERKTSIYLVIPPKMLQTHSKFLRLFVSIAINCYSHGGKAKIPGLFVIDEAPALGYMEQLSSAYSVMGSYNLKLWTFFQNRGQLDDLYGSQAKSLISGSRAIQLFAIEHQDAEWVAAMLGTRSMVDLDNLSSESSVMGLRNAASIVDEIGDKENEDLAKAQYIIRLGKPPMKLDMLPYFKSYRFALSSFRDPDHPWPPKPYKNIRLLISPIYFFTCALAPLAYTIFLPAFAVGLYSILPITVLCMLIWGSIPTLAYVGMVFIGTLLCSFYFYVQIKVDDSFSFSDRTHKIRQSLREVFLRN